jgi:prepilin-type N-terminal cleavage/methylation domain-containing protein
MMNLSIISEHTVFCPISGNAANLMPFSWARLKRQPRGFTLFEILVVIFIIGIVVPTLLLAYRTVLTTTETINSTLSSQMTTNSCLERMVHDLEAIHVTTAENYQKPDTGEAPDQFLFLADSDDSNITGHPLLSFSSSAHLNVYGNQGGKSPGGITRIEYALKSSSHEDSHWITRSDNLHLLENEPVNPLVPAFCQGVESLEFAFFDHEGEAFNSWNSDDPEFGYATPRSMDITLKLASKTGTTAFITSVLFPVYREARE